MPRTSAARGTGVRKDPAGVDVRGANLERRRDAVVEFGPVELVCLMRAAYDGAVG